MQYYKLILAYDGTNYQGWQAQPNGCAVANVLYSSFRSVFKQDLHILGASRTDAGVHALGQVVRIATQLSLDAKTLLKVWNAHLPPDILIRLLTNVADDFHPMRSVVQKTYWYHFFLSRPLPFVSRFGLYVPYQVDIQKLSEALHLFVGTHDFRSFCTGWERDDTVRTIDAISLTYLARYNAYRIEVRGQSFLHHMIRRIVGASLAVAARPQLSTDTILEAFAKKDPQQTLPNAPAHGLVLYKIQYT